MERDKKNFLQIEEIVESFVRNALILARDSLSVDESNRQWYERVAGDTGLNTEAVKRIHHPVYWYLVSSNNGESSLEYVQATKRGEKSKICFRNGYGVGVDNLVKKLTREVLVKYGLCLEAKFNNACREV